MSKIERLTVTVTADIADTVREAVAGGDYASASEVVREAMRDWRHKRALRDQELASLKADVAAGLADVQAGRTKPFDAGGLVAAARRRRSGGA